MINPTEQRHPELVTFGTNGNQKLRDTIDKIIAQRDDIIAKLRNKPAGAIVKWSLDGVEVPWLGLINGSNIKPGRIGIHCPEAGINYFYD